MADPLDAPWDVVVIGTGIGGGTAARALAEGGMRVLMLEQGPAGYRSEETRHSITLPDPVERLKRGFWPDRVTYDLDSRTETAFPVLGAGVGGTSVFYAATLERPAPHDLDDLPGAPHPTGGWPIRHAELSPWLDRAEDLYQVHGDPVPGLPGPPLPPAPVTPTEARIAARLTARGLHPYRQHSAIAYLPGCQQCHGHKCPRPCKMDGRSAGVEPALATGRAALVTGARVTRLVAEGAQVTGVDLIRDGAARRIAAARVVLAGGALASPGVLWASAGPDWPAGLGNRHDQLGRNLMFHLNEVFAHFPGGADPGPVRGLALRDLYHVDGQRLGMVQAMGITVGMDEILHVLRTRAARWPGGRARLVTEGLRLPALVAHRLLGRAALFVGLLEDLPYAQNRLRPDPARIAVDYRLHPELLSRRRLFRRLIARRLGRTLFLQQTPEPNWGHPCGTLRMGTDPRVSVTGPDGRVHGLANLWVADAGLFPTSMGVNPSLTIAALALRAAHLILTGARE
jgi:choline dehydrogenase-like flavoprotein